MKVPASSLAPILRSDTRTEAEKLLDAWDAENPGMTERLMSLRASALARSRADDGLDGCRGGLESSEATLGIEPR